MNTHANPSASPVYVSLEFTPNPNTLKYSVNRELLARGAVNIVKKADAESLSPLAVKLFAIPGIAAVMIGKDFVTVTKTEEGDWDLVHKECSKTIEQHLSSGEPVLNQASLNQDAHKGGSSDIEKKIREILDNEIRPAVAMDGGDITFEKYEAGIVYLYMQGSCAGCPSSTATLKMGIETRLRDAIPEVLEVVAV
ncbi:MAG: NifU family protein [Oligoflexia bacterium]|nr:NifU family protein [Oligoflexia bacterium]